MVKLKNKCGMQNFPGQNVWQAQNLKKFNRTIIPLALIEYETGYSQLGAMRLLGYLPSHIQRALMEELFIILKKHVQLNITS